MENKVFQFSPDYTIHPGEYIDELLDVYGMKQTELALRLGITTKHLNNLISGKVSVTPEMAQGLQQVFQRTAKYWLLLQANYDLSIQKEKRREWFEVHEKECKNWLELFDYPMMVKQNYLKKKIPVMTLNGQRNCYISLDALILPVGTRCIAVNFRRHAESLVEQVQGLVILLPGFGRGS